MRDKSDSVILSVPKGSNLDDILRDSICAFRGFTEVFGMGMHAIALALSTPQDNSAEVQRLVDETTKQINASTDKVEDAIKSQKGE